MPLFIHGVGNRQINRRKPIRIPQSDRRLDEAKFDSRCRNRTAMPSGTPGWQQI